MRFCIVFLFLVFFTKAVSAIELDVLECTDELLREDIPDFNDFLNVTETVENILLTRLTEDGKSVNLCTCVHFEKEEIPELIESGIFEYSILQAKQNNFIIEYMFTQSLNEENPFNALCFCHINALE